MHPTLAAALATERHADLLRTAEAYREAAAVTRSRRRSTLTRGVHGVTQLATALRSRIAVPAQTEAELCCA